MDSKTNIVILDREERVEMFEWAKTHPNCSTLIIKEDNDGNNDTMLLKAYALNEDGNNELNSLPFAFDDNIEYFGGISASMMNHIGGVV